MHTVPLLLIMAVGSGLTVTARGLWFVMHPAAFTSRTEIFPLMVPNVTVIDAAEGSPMRAAPVGRVHV